MPSEQSHRCHLLSIAVELRLRIYDYVLAGLKIDTNTSRTVYTLQRAASTKPAILRVCSHIRREAMQSYHARLHDIYREMVKDSNDFFAQCQRTCDWLATAQQPLTEAQEDELVEMLKGQDRTIFPLTDLSIIVMQFSAEMEKAGYPVRQWSEALFEKFGWPLLYHAGVPPADGETFELMCPL